MKEVRVCRGGFLRSSGCFEKVETTKGTGEGRGGEGGSYGSNDKCSGWVFHLSLVYTSSNYICFHQDIVKIKAVQ